MAKTQRTDDKARHNFVAQAQQHHRLKHAVAQTNGGGHGDIVAAEQRQFHRILPLRYAVTHCRNAASDLRRCAFFARKKLYLLGIAAIGLMRRQHVIIRGDDANVHRLAAANGRLVIAASRKAMR